MRLKKLLIFLGLISLTVLFISNISAANTCWVASSLSNCVGTQGGQVVMDVAAVTNAHSEFPIQMRYASVLCCNFGNGSQTCTGNNEILRLSAQTNAHSEAPDLVTPNYMSGNNICYGPVTNCRSTTFNCGVNETSIIYLSNYTNAHVESSGLSPQNYGTQICCTVTPPPSLCNLTSASWQYNNVSQGTPVGITVSGTNCNGVQLSISVYRRSNTPCSSIGGCSNPTNIPFSNGVASGSWTATPSHANKYYFVASVVGNSSISVTSSSDLLVNPPINCAGVGFCSDYNTSSDCGTNVCGINVQKSVPGSVNCTGSNTNCFCSWSPESSPACNGAWNLTNVTNAVCGNGKIEPGETCDGSNLSGLITSCKSFNGYTGGTLGCNAPGTPNQCQYNTSLCTGGNGAGPCGNGIINTGETCDGNPGDSLYDWGPITGCNSFDNFTEGTLSCSTSTCLFNTSRCAVSSGDIGTCFYTSQSNDTCADGFLDVNLNAKWIWAPGNPSHSDPQNLSASCNSKSERLVCPAQIPLPFFGIYNLIAAVAIIAVIYFVIESGKKKRKKK